MVALASGGLQRLPARSTLEIAGGSGFGTSSCALTPSMANSSYGASLLPIAGPVQAQMGKTTLRATSLHKQRLHEKFYASDIPDNPSVSCGNEADCYPTEIKYVTAHLRQAHERTASTFPFRPKM